jgi:tetratricopeptide (TPR) repeat protein
MLDRLRIMQIQGRLEAAEASFRRILRQCPTHLHGWIGLSYCASLNDQHDEALRAAKEAIRAQPVDLDAVIDCSQALIHLGSFDSARALLRAQRPQVRVEIALGELEERVGQLDKALGCYETAHLLDAEAELPLRKLIMLHRRLGAYAAAHASADRLGMIGSSQLAAAWYHHGQLYMAAGDADAAIDAFRRALDQRPDYEACLIEFAQTLRKLGRLEEGLAVLTSCPATYGLLLALSDLELARPNHDAALSYAEAAQALNPARVDGLTRLTIIEIDRRGHGAAHAAVDRIVTVGAEHIVTALRYRLVVYRAEGREQEGLEVARDMVRRQPADLAMKVELARQHRRLGERFHAWETLRAVLRRDPDHIGALAEIGDQASQQEDYVTALACSRRITTLDPTNIGQQLRLADILLDLGENEAAEAVWADMQTRFGHTSEVAAQRIRRLRDQGALPEALEVARRAFRAFPGHMHFWREVFDLTLRFGTVVDAQDVIAAVPAHDRGAVVQLRLAEARLAVRLNDRKRAITHLSAALELEPLNPSILGHLFHLSTYTSAFREAQRYHARLVPLEAPSRRMRGASANASQSALGQMVNEFLVDRKAMDELQTLLPQSPNERIPVLLEAMRKRPNHVPTAIMLLSSLGEAAVFSDKDPITPEPSSKIPKRISQFWDNPSPPSDLQDLSRSWAEVNPGYDHRLFNEQSALQYLEEGFASSVPMAFQRCRDATTKADLFRLAVLVRDGGIWADMDDRCLKSIEDAIPPQTEIAFWRESLGSIGNNFIATRPAHPIMRRALTDAVVAINRGDRDNVWLQTGPGLLTRAFALTLAESGAQWRSLLGTITVFEEPELFQLVAIHCRASYKRLGQHWSRQSFGSGQVTTIGKALEGVLPAAVVTTDSAERCE